MDRTLRVVEYTQQVGRSLKNIRNYNPRTHLHGGLPEKRSRTRMEETSSLDMTPTILALNATDAEVPIYGIVEISRDTMAQSPVPNSQQYQQAVWNANKPIEANEGVATYGIAQESIAPGVVGKVCISGTTPVVAPINTNVLEHDISTYYVMPTYSPQLPFSGYMTQDQTPIRVFGSVINDSWQRVLFCYIEPFVDNIPIPAVVVSTVSAMAAVNIYNVRLYGNGYSNPYTGEAYMYLAETSYGRNVPNGTRLIVYRHMIDTAVGEGDI